MTVIFLLPKSKIFKFTRQQNIIKKKEETNKTTTLTDFDLFPLLDIHSMVQLPPAQGRHPNRRDQRRLPQRPEAHAPARSHQLRAAAQAGSRQNALPQDRQRQQGLGLHSVQGRQACVHRCRGNRRRQLENDSRHDLDHYFEICHPGHFR